MTNEDLGRFATLQAQQCLKEMVDLIIPPGTKREPTPAEQEAVALGLLLLAANVEAYVVHELLPPEKAASVRAFLDRFLADVQRKKNAVAKPQEASK